MSIGNETKTKVVGMRRARRREAIDTGPGQVEQHHKEECDVNCIIARYKKTGQLPPSVGEKTGQFLDVIGVQDFQHAMDVVSRAKSAFESLPAAVRKQFDNDPVKYVEFYNKEQREYEAKEGKYAPEPEPVVKEEPDRKANEPPKDKPRESGKSGDKDE